MKTTTAEKYCQQIDDMKKLNNLGEETASSTLFAGSITYRLSLLQAPGQLFAGTHLSEQ